VSGIAIQTQKVLTGLVENGWEVVQIGFSRLPHPPQPVMYKGIKIYPIRNTSGYQDAFTFRDIMQRERPDILWVFNDPRFFTWLFEMDSEIRPKVKIVYWHLWDNEPYPKFNNKWYNCCDEIVTIARFSHNLLNSAGISNVFIPHGLNGKEFYKLPPTKRTQKRKELLVKSGMPDCEFIVFANNRNFERKRLPDTVLAFKRFAKRHPRSMLFLHTDIIDPGGIDLQRFIKDVEPGNECIVFRSGQLVTDLVNDAYNLSDVYVTNPYNEGFGLSVGEALLAETPVIATPTGGITEQLQGEDGTVFGIKLPIDVKSIFGTLSDPYIFRDFSSVESIENALEEAYKQFRKPTWQQLGKLGRAHILKNYSEELMVQKWCEFLPTVLEKPKTYKRFELITL
jgi:glycosyltransferase involved in cell wall biosynthesis